MKNTKEEEMKSGLRDIIETIFKFVLDEKISSSKRKIQSLRYSSMIFVISAFGSLVAVIMRSPYLLAYCLGLGVIYHLGMISVELTK